MSLDLALGSPSSLLLLAPWLAAVIVLAVRQRRAHAWLVRHVSPRFLDRATRWTSRGLAAHLAGLGALGAILVLAGAGPYRWTDATAERPVRTVVLLVDASLSMGAADRPEEVPPEAAGSRFDAAKSYARGLVERLPDSRFAIVSYSGVPVVHTPPTAERASLDTLLATLRLHLDLDRSGSSFATGFETVAALMAEHSGPFDVVLLSDGEMPEPESWGDALELLTERGVRVHTVAVGSTTPQGRAIFEPADILAGVAEPRRVATFTTVRQDEELRRIAEAAGGTARVLQDEAYDPAPLAEVLAAAPARPQRVAASAREDLSWVLALLFAVGFGSERLLLGGGRGRRSAERPRRTVRAPASARRRRAARQAAVLALAGLATGALGGCRAGDAVRAHRLNAEGIERLASGDADAAAARFAASAALNVRPERPIHNLGNLELARGDLAAAHRNYQDALLLAPDLAEAHFNDGHALFLWAEQEIDVCACELGRGRELLTTAAERFAAATTLARSSEAAQEARWNAGAVAQALELLDRVEERCAKGGGGGEGGDEGGGGEGGGAPPPAGAGQDPPPEGAGGGPPPGGGGEPPPGQPPPLSEEELSQLAQELGRIRSGAAGSASFHQTPASRLPRGEAPAGGRSILW